MINRRILLFLQIIALVSVSAAKATETQPAEKETAFCTPGVPCHPNAIPHPAQPLTPGIGHTLHPYEMPLNPSSNLPTLPSHVDAPRPPSPYRNRIKVLDTGADADSLLHAVPACPSSEEGYTINFQDISVIQLIQFLSKISKTNFIFDSKDLQFNVTIVSEEPASVQDLSAALLQVLKIHGLGISEEGNNVLIYRLPTASANMSRVGTVITNDNVNDACDAAVVTRVFRLNNIDPTHTATLIRPLLSPDAIVQASEETRHLIVSDLTANIIKTTELIAVLDNPDVAFDIAEYQVKNSNPLALVAYAKDILGPITETIPIQIIGQPAAHKIFIVSTPYIIQKALQLLQSLDFADITDQMALPAHALESNQFFMYKLKYQNGHNIATALYDIGINLQNVGIANMEFVNTIQSAQWVPVNNSIVLAGTQDSIAKVVTLLDELDRAPKQVYIEVLILDTTLINSLDFGVQWIALGDEQDKLAFASGLLGNSPPNPNLQGGTNTTPGARFVAANPAANPPLIPNPGRDVPLPVPAQLSGFTDLSNLTEAFGFGIVGNIIRHAGKSFLTLGALISALDEEADTSIVLNPKIMVEDTQPAIFFVGRNIPYQTTSTVIQQTGSVTQNIQYEDVGIELRVTPTISPNNIVTLQIDQSVAEVEGTAGQGNLTPVTTKILSTTRLHVPDGCFLVMSGHIRDQATTIFSGVPCLGSLPLIGPAFSRNIEARSKRNLIMFVRPKVITNIQEGIDLTNQEGYNFNWATNPCSILECGIERAPECETYPPPLCPTH